MYTLSSRERVLVIAAFSIYIPNLKRKCSNLKELSTLANLAEKAQNTVFYQ